MYDKKEHLHAEHLVRLTDDGTRLTLKKIGSRSNIASDTF
jgi:hypothetical protein